MLPGQDLGDTASFQAVAGETRLTPRDGYPLYFAVTGAFVRWLPTEPAYAANLASAACAALAVGVTVLVATELAGALAAGLGAALFLAASYTFWSQAIIAEVYALHLLLMGLSLLALLVWARQPSMGRLALFFALYAFSFGNHQSTILLLPAYAIFLLASAPEGPSQVLRPRVIVLALGLATLGALQYAWNFSALLAMPEHQGLGDQLRAFWFDVTKSDWRASMVDGVRSSQLGNRFQMFLFDLRQQVGLPGIALALTGFLFLFATRWRLGLLLALLWAVNWVFAFTYNVGDVHVFFLPSHFVVCLAAGCGIAWLILALRVHVLKSPSPHRARAAALLLTTALLAYPAWRAWDTFPAVDRSSDTAPRDYYDRLTAGLRYDEVFVRNLNWQAHNGLDYYAKYTKPELPLQDSPEMLQAFPFLVWDNASRRYDVVLTAGAAADVRRAFGTLFLIEPDPRVPVPSLRELAESLPAGTPWVLTALTPYREYPIAQEDIDWVARTLGSSDGAWPIPRYAVTAGVTGQPPLLRRMANRPFRVDVQAGGLAIEIRMEAWLPGDTIRRAGFGRVLVERRPALTLDRGASFVAFNPDGSVRLTAWAGGILAPQPRYLIRHWSVAP